MSQLTHKVQVYKQLHVIVVCCVRRRWRSGAKPGPGDVWCLPHVTQQLWQCRKSQQLSKYKVIIRLHGHELHTASEVFDILAPYKLDYYSYILIFSKRFPFDAFIHSYSFNKKFDMSQRMRIKDTQNINTIVDERTIVNERYRLKGIFCCVYSKMKL